MTVVMVCLNYDDHQKAMWSIHVSECKWLCVAVCTDAGPDGRDEPGRCRAARDGRNGLGCGTELRGADPLHQPLAVIGQRLDTPTPGGVAL